MRMRFYAPDPSASASAPTPPREGRAVRSARGRRGLGGSRGPRRLPRGSARRAGFARTLARGGHAQSPATLRHLRYLLRLHGGANPTWGFQLPKVRFAVRASAAAPLASVDLGRMRGQLATDIMSWRASACGEKMSELVERPGLAPARALRRGRHLLKIPQHG